MPERRIDIDIHDSTPKGREASTLIPLRLLTALLGGGDVYFEELSAATSGTSADTPADVVRRIGLTTHGLVRMAAIAVRMAARELGEDETELLFRIGEKLEQELS